LGGAAYGALRDVELTFTQPLLPLVLLQVLRQPLHEKPVLKK
jgi:hypothetical protein